MRGRRRAIAGALVALATALGGWLWYARDGDEVPHSDPDRPSGDEPANAGQPPRFSCSHPYIPFRVGTVLTYLWEGPQQGTVTVRLARAQEHADGMTYRWVIETETGQRSTRLELARECDLRGAEEPWVGIGAGGPIQLANQTWRLPHELAEGSTYGGSLQTTLLGLSITIARSHTIGEATHVEVEAGSYDVLEVAIEDRTEHAAPIASRAFLARGVGLVRLELSDPSGQTASYELASVHIPVEP